MDYAKESLRLHKEWKGKIQVVANVPVETKDDLSLAYTPGVAQPCLEIQKDIEKSYELTRRWNMCLVVTDGSAVLGLGDIGPEAGMPVMEGKCVLFKAFGDVDAFPLCIKSHDVDEIVNTIYMISGSFGGVNLEDISAPRCFEIERRLKEKLDIPVFHDDQHGTAIISGAGLPVSLPELVEGAKTKIAPIVSTAKSAMVICKMWDRKYKRIPDLLVIEGPLAGGHLGFSREDLSRYGADTKDVPHTYHQDLYDEEIRGIMKVVKQFEEKYQKHIPVAIAGGIYTREDVEHAMELGADAVQVATRFVTTEECDAPESYKQAYINAKAEDIVITQSPVGMPGRAIVNPFLEKITAMKERGEKAKITHCYQCLEHCDPANIPYCITKALSNAAEGALNDALLFCGSNAYRADKIETVEAVVQDLVGTV